MRYANAGHPKPLLIRRSASRVEPLAKARQARASPLLGFVRSRNLRNLRGEARSQRLVMLFTDGLYEVQDRNNELYSQEMLVAGVQRRTQLPAPQLFDELLAEIRRFSGDNGFADDVCLVGR